MPAFMIKSFSCLNVPGPGPSVRLGLNGPRARKVAIYLLTLATPYIAFRPVRFSESRILIHTIRIKETITGARGKVAGGK